jgi:hypothetical protein
VSHITLQACTLTSLTVPSLFSIPLNTSFPADGLLSSTIFTEVDAPKQWNYQGAFFQDANETLLYCFGGYYDQPQPINDLNTFNITSGEWSIVSVRGGNFNHGRRLFSSDAISSGSSEALGFVAGGREEFFPGMIRFNGSNPTYPEWRNETMNNPPLTIAGSMIFIRLGPKGSLINFGGYNTYSPNPADTVTPYDRQPIGQINVYDVESATWYNVTSGGDVPGDRADFCTVVSSAPDDSSFQITMYGGWDRIQNNSYADIYVLSIPSFQWIKVPESAPNLDAHLANGAGIYGRRFHSCVAYKDRQMLVLGGELLENDQVLNFKECSEDYPVIRVLDLSTFEWKSSWDGDSKAYTVPDIVRKVIGGSANGGATLKEPQGGFNDSALNTIFARVAPRYSPSNSSGDDTAGNPPAGDKTSAPLTPGTKSLGSVPTDGGIAAIAIIFSLVVFFLRKRTRKADASKNDAQHPILPELHHGKSLHELQGGGWNATRQPGVTKLDTGVGASEMPGDHCREQG